MSACRIDELGVTPPQLGLRRELSTNNFQSTSKRAREGYACNIPLDDVESAIANSSDDEEEAFNVDAIQQERLGMFDNVTICFWILFI